jgi:hypothetical protein
MPCIAIRVRWLQRAAGRVRLSGVAREHLSHSDADHHAADDHRGGQQHEAHLNGETKAGGHRSMRSECNHGERSNLDHEDDAAAGKTARDERIKWSGHVEVRRHASPRLHGDESRLEYGRRRQTPTRRRCERGRAD